MVESVNVLCMGLPSASRTACEVKFSDGIRLIKCFCLFFSCIAKSVSVWSLQLAARTCRWAQSTYILNNLVHGWIGILEMG